MSKADIIFKYFPNLTEDQKQKFNALYDVYKEWNDQINIISRKDFDSIYQKHVLHSPRIAQVIQFQKGSEILDVGTGGGFPGIPLAIMYPDSDFYLVDSIGKKIKVVNEVKAALGLTNVFAGQKRAEELKQ